MICVRAPLSGLGPDSATRPLIGPKRKLSHPQEQPWPFTQSWPGVLRRDPPMGIATTSVACSVFIPPARLVYAVCIPTRVLPMCMERPGWAVFLVSWGGLQSPRGMWYICGPAARCRPAAARAWRAHTDTGVLLRSAGAHMSSVVRCMPHAVVPGRPQCSRRSAKFWCVMYQLRSSHKNLVNPKGKPRAVLQEHFFLSLRTTLGVWWQDSVYGS